MNKNRKRVLVINVVPLVNNGISELIMNLFKNSNKIDFEIVTNETCEDKYKKFFGANYNLRVLPSRKKKLIGYFLQLISIIRKNQYDIIHIHGNSSSMLLEVVSSKIGSYKSKIVVHTHNTSIHYNLFNFFLKRLFNKSFNLAIACGEKAGKELYTRPFEIIKNGIDLEKFHFDGFKRSNFREKLNIKTDYYVIGHIGNINKQKNHLFILKIFNELLKCNITKPLLLFLVGRDESDGQIIKKIHEMGLEDKVFLYENVSDINKFYSSFDVFILPSLFEGFPLVSVEAQASGLPCIFSDKIDSGVLLTPTTKLLPLNEKMWVSEITSLLNDYDVGREKTSNSNCLILEEKGFSIKQSSIKVSDLYSLL
ncbi:MAG: glycosyltransferase [Lactococcus cremoris]